MLRKAKRGDDAWLGAWLPDIARSFAYQPAAGADRRRVIMRRRADTGPGALERAGILFYRTHWPRLGDAVIELVATPAEHARRGAGMAAVALLEQEFHRRGIRRIFAPAPAGHGIAMYFWFRLGYRPLERDAWPCAREGVAWLVRRIDGR